MVRSEVDGCFVDVMTFLLSFSLVSLVLDLLDARDDAVRCEHDDTAHDDLRDS